jgi:hypothetical protein
MYSSKNYNFLLAFYECGTWSATLREQHRLRLFEYRVLRGIIGPKWEEISGVWRKLSHILHASPKYY